MTTTRLLIASLCLALAACAGSIDEPGQGGDGNADNTDNTDNPDDNTDNPDDNTDNPDDNNPPAPTFTATVFPTITAKCVGCHVGVPFNFNGSASEVYDRIMAKAGLVDLANPANSVIFKKPTNGVPHGGGAILTADGAEATAILDWIEGGAEL